mmetsp:Transcript_29458/g.57699  ORF Transcript_29458/g.57699 Transcript_29458/m.57699 type:complete len:201 (-) Transcript_29458:7-609(-)
MVADHFIEAWDRSFGGPRFWRPKPAAQGGFAAMGEDLVRGNPKHGFGTAPAHLKPVTEVRRVTNLGAAVHPQRFGDAWDHEQQGHLRVGQYVQQPVDAIIAGPIRDQQRAFILDLDKARRIALGRYIEVCAVRGCQDQKRRVGDELHAMGIKMCNHLGGRVRRGIAIERAKSVRGHQVGSFFARSLQQSGARRNADMGTR